MMNKLLNEIKWSDNIKCGATEKHTLRMKVTNA